MTVPSIGIITLDGNHNYGNRLQLYASAMIYSKLGFTVVALVPRDNIFSYESFMWQIKRVIKKIIGRGKEISTEDIMSPERLDAFKRFTSLVPSQEIQRDDIDSLADYFDYFSVGSDQVWNPEYNRYEEKWFYLKFARPDQRIALSPSIGLDRLNMWQLHKLKKGIKGFKYLSIREQKGLELIKKSSGREAFVTPDPTLVLDAKEWRTVADGRLTPSIPYVFTYLLGETSTEVNDVLEQVTDRGQIEILSLSDRQKPNEFDAGPAEFIDLIDHASHVVTDSFHAAVFSSILQTPLTIVHREGGASMFSRLEQLSQTLGIEEKVYGSAAYDLSLAGDYEGVPEAIGRERQKFMVYLEGCLAEKMDRPLGSVRG